MKRILIAILLFGTVPLFFPACSTAPDQRVVVVQSLKSVGEGAEATIALSAQLYANKTISANQARAVMDFYDTQFQPAYRAAATAAKGDLTSFAAPDVQALALQLAALLAQYTQVAK